jgi:hypothetical protein
MNTGKYLSCYFPLGQIQNSEQAELTPKEGHLPGRELYDWRTVSTSCASLGSKLRLSHLLLKAERKMFLTAADDQTFVINVEVDPKGYFYIMP